jgi:carboxymethylenebutenolidase
MRDSTLSLPTGDGRIEVYEALPEAAPLGAVIVVQEAFGVNDHIRDVTRRFAAASYRAVAPAFFHRAGGGTAPYGDFAKVMPLFQGLTDDGILMDVDAAVAHLEAAGFRPSQIGLVGFCFGGRVSFLAAVRRRLGAAVGFYGGGLVNARFPIFPALVGEAAKLRTPWLGLFGDRDESIPVADVEQLREALDSNAKVAHEIVRYADAEHGFHCDVRPSYKADAAQDAWQRTLKWLDRHLSPS